MTNFSIGISTAAFSSNGEQSRLSEQPIHQRVDQPTMNALTRLHNRLQKIVPLEKRSKVMSFALVLLATSVDNLNVTGAITSYDSIYQRFDANTSTVSWSLSAYALTLGAFIMLAGKVTDMLGAHRVFSVAVTLMAICSLITAVIDHSIIALIVFRAFQGMFAAFLIPSAFAVASGYFKGPNFIYALIGLMLALTGTFGLGMVLGGVFSVTSIGYKGLYYLTFGISFLVAILLYLTMAPVERTEEHKNMEIKNLDFYGSGMFVVGLLLIILGFTQSGEKWDQPSVYVPLPIGFLVLIGAFYFELVYVSGYQDKVNKRLAADKEAAISVDDLKKDSNEVSLPSDISAWRYSLQVLFPSEALKVPNFLVFLCSTPLLQMAFMTMMTVEVEYWIYVERDSPLIAGLKIFPTTVGFFVGMITNRENIIYKISMKWVLISSQFVTIGMIVWIAQHKYTDGRSYWIYELVPLTIYGWLLSIYMGVYINAVLRRTPVHLHGVVSGLLQTAAEVAICVATAVTASLLGEIAPALTSEAKVRLDHRMDKVFYLIYACIGTSVLVMVLLKDQKSVGDAEEEITEATEEAETASVSKEAEEDDDVSANVSSDMSAVAERPSSNADAVNV